MMIIKEASQFLFSHNHYQFMSIKIFYIIEEIREKGLVGYFTSINEACTALQSNKDINIVTIS